MTEFKPGDRVKAEYEGVVMEGGAYADLVLVAHKSADRQLHVEYMLPGSLTLLGPEEPTGVGAVVRDTAGLMYVRTPDKHTDYPWSELPRASHTNWELHSWGEVCENGPITILYEGVVL